MTLLEKTFQIEITEADADMLCNLLHAAYLQRSEAYAANPNPVACKEMYAAREYRNIIAGLINKTYCGNDA